MKKQIGIDILLCIIGYITLLIVMVCVTVYALSDKPEKKWEVVSEEIVQEPARYESIKTADISDILAYEVPLDYEPIKCSLPEETQEFAYYIASAYDMDFRFLMAVMSVESDFDSDAISDSNDWGLMQINKCNHKWLSEKLGITDFLNPRQNIYAGAYIFASLFEKYEDANKVLMAYHMGETGAKKLWEAGVYETKYTDCIWTAFEELGVE